MSYSRRPARSSQVPIEVAEPNADAPLPITEVLPDKNITLTEIRGLAEHGNTIRVSNLHRAWLPLHRTCTCLEQVFSCPAHAHLYLTPAHHPGLARHFDYHDVLIIRLTGTKRWLFQPPPAVLPRRFATVIPFEEGQDVLRYEQMVAPAGTGAARSADTAGPFVDVELQPGDLLYLPRGHYHSARAIDSTSVHVTIGLHVLTWEDVFSVALGQVARVAAPDQRVDLADSLKSSTSQLLKAASELPTPSPARVSRDRQSSALTGFSKTVEKDFRRRA